MTIKRMQLGIYRTETHTGPRIPCLATLKKKVDSGMLPGEVVGGDYFVWVNKHYIPTWPDWHERCPVDSTAKTTASAIAERFIRDTIRVKNDAA